MKLHIIVPLNRHQCFASTVSVAGPKWKEHRKLFTPAFHFKILEDFVEVFGSNDRILIEKLEKHVNGPGFDICPYISLYTLDIICGKHNVPLVAGAQHVLWHNYEITECATVCSWTATILCGIQGRKINTFLSTIQRIRGSRGKASLILIFRAKRS